MDRITPVNNYMKASILAAMLVGTPVSDANAQSYCNSAGCYVTGIGGGDGGGGWGGGSGGGGNGGTEDDRPQEQGDPRLMCPILKTHKPNNCANPPSQRPGGAYFAEDKLPAGSAMRKLMSLSRRTPDQGLAPAARATLVRALDMQVDGFFYGLSTLSEIQNVMVRDVLDACQSNRAWTDRWRYLSGTTTPMERECSAAADALIAESDNRMGYWPWFVQWAANDGIALSDLGIPAAIIDALSSKNSVTKRYNVVTEESICYNWWAEVNMYGCN